MVVAKIIRGSPVEVIDPIQDVYDAMVYGGSKPPFILGIPIELNIINMSKKNIVIWNVTSEIIDIKSGIRYTYSLEIKNKPNDNTCIGVGLNIESEKMEKVYAYLQIAYFGAVAKELTNIFSEEGYKKKDDRFNKVNPSLYELYFYSLNDVNRWVTRSPPLSWEFCQSKIKLKINTIDRVEREVNIDSICSVFNRTKEVYFTDIGEIINFEINKLNVWGSVLDSKISKETGYQYFYH